MLSILFLVLSCFSVFANPFFAFLGESTSNCQNACHKLVNGKINVHLVPHSHNDVGWLKTYDEYYDGTGMLNVRSILNSTIKALNESSQRRFVQVETAFFYKWWNDQDQETRNLAVDLVNSGRLEMINGGWSMNDEAATHYHSIIDQFTLGFRILEETVGVCGRPKIGWQIDPFGHSREHASLMKQLGFEGLVIGRLDYRDKEQREIDKNLDFIWTTNDNFNTSESQIFTTMFPDFYTYEDDFLLEIYYDFMNDFDIFEKRQQFKQILNTYKDFYKTSNIMIPMGSDFTYQQAEKNFALLDKLIKGFAHDHTYNVIYSTPSCYIQAVKEEMAEKNIQLTVKTDDFFPYASSSHSFWTGYFTSRPTSKRFERLSNNILQSAKQMTTFSRVKGNDDDKNINKLRMAMGVMQHHDAITGTETQAVADDYTFLLNEGIKETEESISRIITDLLKKNENSSLNLNLSYCLRSNMSICDNSKKDRFVVAVQNPLSKTVSHYVRLPVDGENYQITGAEEDVVAFDIFDTIHSFVFVNDSEPATKELVFLAKDLPPLGVKLYFIEKIDAASNVYHPFENVTSEETSFGNEFNGFTIDANGKLSSVKIDGVNLNINHDFYYYTGWSKEPQFSGAYVFRPSGDAILVNDKLQQIKFAKGNLVDEVYQMFSDEITQIIKVYKGEGDNYIEFDWLVGNLVVDGNSTEVITKFTVADFNSNGIFYSDSNGRQQMKRTKNKRSDYTYDPTEEPVSSNYYPITTNIVIKDETKKLEVAVLTDRSQGGSSLQDGAVELMVHRRITTDDGFGVGEALREDEYGIGLYARGQHYLTFGEVAEGKQAPAVVRRKLAHRLLLAPVVLVGDATSGELALNVVADNLNFQFAGLTKSLPDNVQILTLEPWKDSYLLRLEHIFERNEDVNLSADATVDLENLFTLFNITEITATSLGANRNLDTTTSRFINSFKLLLNIVQPPNLKILLKPMEIKTFIVKTDKNNDGGHDIGIVDVSGGALSLNSALILLILISGFVQLF